MNEKKLSFDSFFYILENLFSDSEIIYVSTPISTGEIFINWYSSVGKKFVDNSIEFNNERRKNVIEPNIRNAKTNIKKIKNKINKIVIDPTNFEKQILDWSQNELYQFWKKVIETLVDSIIFLDGWEFSIGCCVEVLTAIENGIEIYSQDMDILTIKDMQLKLKNSIKLYKLNNLNDWIKINNILEKIQKYDTSSVYKVIEHDRKMKDEKLDLLITNDIANVAQFISFGPYRELKPRYVHINKFEYEDDLSNKEIIKKLILASPSKSVNIRSFSHEIMKGNKLILGKGIDDIDEILRFIKRNSKEGKYSIINENIDINDGGVSGVILGEIIEFSPEDTPKCVDREGVCSLPKDIAFKILLNVYGFVPNIKFEPNYRVEFSIHPSRQGVKKEHTVIWEYEYYDNIEYERKILWPNRFSRFIGDKVFGLLIADALGLKVPKTNVVSRKVAPFSFGVKTGLKEKWIRTSPVIKEPGKYYTGMNWVDPFELISKEEAKGDNEVNIASIISQDAVNSLYSGASIIKAREEYDIIEGVSGKGDDFMVGLRNKENLPEEVISKVQLLNNELRSHHKIIGDVSIEWVYDGKDVWIVQLNQLMAKKHNLDGNIIVKGNPLYYEKFFVTDGLGDLRKKIELLKGKNVGIELIGNVGITSHFGDLLRLSNIPSLLRNSD